MTEEQYRHICDALDIQTQRLESEIRVTKGEDVEVLDAYLKHMASVVAFHSDHEGVYA